MPSEFTDAWRIWQRAQHLSDRTIDARLLTVERLGRHTRTDPATAHPEDVTGFLASLDVSRSAVATYHGHLRAWFKWLVKMGHRIDDPMVFVPQAKPPKRRPRPVTDRELAAILNVPVRRRTRMMLLLATYQGLRVHEIARVRGEDVNLHDGLLRVAGKGDTDEILPLHPLVAAEAARFPRRGWWFPSYELPGQPVLRQSVTQTIGKVFRRAGVNGGAHRLRHWYATRLLRNGANVRVVQHLLRHASLQTTALYTEVSPEEERAAIDSLEVARLPQAA